MVPHTLPQLIAPPFPLAGFQVWEWFLELHDARQPGLAFAPISYSELNAYFIRRKENPSQWDLEVIRRLDGIAKKHQAKGKNGN